ncbi:sulfotransferase [Halomonas faecis]|uniref:sulfotransferase n=1 Tax=Halomonas faecis TaxID=1562110 RepID=UPI0013D42444|nr:sulfotransferase [Halomonas faecis]
MVFIIGPPRSGSTLLMQTLTDAYDVGYLTNRHCRWFGAPALAERLYNPLGDKSPSDFQSNYGRTKKPSDPAECGAWWYRFFRRQPAYVTRGEVSERKMRAFSRSIASLQNTSGKPLIFKNLYASLRLDPMSVYLPEALYIVIERDLKDNAESILKGRKDALGSYQHWWSVPPPNVGALDELSPVQQAVGQIESIHELIDRDIERLGLEDRVFRVSYEDFCEDVHGTLYRFQDFMARHGIELERRFEVPYRFEIEHSQKIPQDMYEELGDYVDQRNKGKENQGTRA